MTTVKVRKIGNSLGFTIPKDVIARLRVEVGDELFLCEGPNGYSLTPYDPEFAEQMQVAETVMKNRRNMLRKLGQ